MSEKPDEIDLLERIHGRNKKRDLRILRLVADGYTQKNIGKVVNLVRNRISEIETTNAEVLDELTVKAEFALKAGRMRLYSRVIRGKGEVTGKDLLDWLEGMRREIEGNGKNGTAITVNVINKVVVDVIGVIKQHVKDPETRNRIAEHLRQLS